MNQSAPVSPLATSDASTLKADLAFFEARLSLASGMADTSYQRAQSKVFQVLGKALAERLSQLGAGPLATDPARARRVERA
ncbi:MAG: hypothetical protein KDI88_04725 [Gammaproteobacteria bacterium]|nr:hypothetical protein [Gammaproteobacteria bacterium]